MRAATVERYGPPDTIRITTRPIPAPGRGEVLVGVEAASVNSGDARIRAGRFPRGFGLLARLGIGLRGPRRSVLGVVFSGTVERLGEGVAGFSVGAAVAGMTGARFGAHAEYVTVPVTALTPLPAGVTHPDAAGALFGGSTALHFLRDRAKLRAGQTVLVNGASGSVGSAAVQLAVHFGAIVTAVSSSPNHDLLRRLGAARVIDYRETPVAELGDRFDVVFDAVGNLSRRDGLRLADPHGAVVLAVAGLADTVTARGRVIAGPAPERSEDFALLLDLVAGKEFDPLVEVVGGIEALPEAHRRIDSGRKVGNLVIVPRGAQEESVTTAGEAT
ncbi:NAD(P)-dependent alcohol dehydrogenase [Nocardia higoensis]|uniref:NAD(P)-dependent alcohol dehydrogenase n=1 Tax=Nocardia higoensis TaxID=228599 RepID=UPI0003033CCD|nr:NAD(P)-dependent alcohol dehydrogenase [Nocardia higoensis]